MSRFARTGAAWVLAPVIALLMLALAGLAFADEPSPTGEDHLVVSRLPAAANAQAVTIVRVNGSGASDGANWALPTAPSGSNNRFTLEGDSSAVGSLALSADGRYVTLAGYTQPLGTTLGNSSDTAPRVVARVDSLGNVNTTTTLSTNFTQEKIRGAVTSDGSGFWVTGHGNTANPKGGMVYAKLGTSTPTVLFTKASVSPENSALNNTRTVQIAGGNVYFGSEKGTAGIFRTTGLPTTAQAPTSAAAFGGDGSGPVSLLLLRHEAGGTVDTMYVVQETVGIFKFSLSGSTWTNRGKVASGSFAGVAGKVDGSGDFRLYAISGTGAANTLVKMTDTAAFNAAPTAGAPTVVSTAAAGTAYRGIAFAPHDESVEEPVAATPTIELSDTSLSGTVSDPTNPTVDVTVAQSGVEAAKLSVAASATSKASVAAIGGVGVTGSGATRTVSVTPAGGVGYADVTLKVSGEGGKTATTVLHYAASAASSTPATSRYHTGASDASTAIDAGGGYMLLGNDENNVIRMYRRDFSGAPVKSWDFNSQMGSPEEIDIEGSARVGNTIYWTGSMGNSKKGNLKPDRSILFTTKISGSGAATELSFGGYYRGLRADLIAWDQSHGNQFGFAAGAAAGNIPKQINGFNVEGMEFAPGNSTSAYVGFRAPLSPANAGGDAIVVPVTNLGQLATSGQNTTLHATFGAPILLDLDGLSIRELRKNAADEYLIVAGSWAASGEQALFTWDGAPADPPVRALTPLPPAEGSGDEAGAWESVVSLATPLATGDDLQLVMDVGATDLYGDGLEAKELIAQFQKSRSDHFTLELPVVAKAPVNTAVPTVTGGSTLGSQLSCSPGTWTGTPAPSFSYRWQRNGADIPVGTAADYTAAEVDSGKAVRCVVTATNASDSVEAASAPISIGFAYCSSDDVSAAGSALQAPLHSQAWIPGFAAATCSGGPTVDYQATSGADALAEWNADGSKGSIDTGIGLIGSDEAPTAAQIANIKAAAPGAQVAVVPVAQTAVSILAHLPAGCALEGITNGNLTAVFEGRLTNWSKVEGAEGSCDAPIVRVVGKDGSGATGSLKNYLYALYKGGLLCTSGATEGRQSWQEMDAASWPQSCGERALSPLLRPAGAGEEVEQVNATPGSIGYALLPAAKAKASPDTVSLAMQNNGQRKGGDVNFAAAAQGTIANCGALTYQVPKVSSGRDLDWSAVFGAKPAAGGESYPLCALTYAVALHGYQAAGFSEGQGRTARDYLNAYVVQAAGQAAAAGHYYSRLPTSYEPKLDVLGAARRAAETIR